MRHRNLIHIRQSLAAALTTATPRAQRQPRPRPAAKEDDLAILEARRLRETHGMSARAIAVHMAAIGVPMTITRVTNVIEYATRAHLVPTAGRREPYLSTTT